MRIETNSNLVYDDEYHRCNLIIRPLSDKIKFAIVTCIDTKTQEAHSFIGQYDDEHPKDSIKNIMGAGQDFNELLKMFIYNKSV